MKTDHIYDFIAIGVGPFNLGLACLTDPISELDGIFLDKRDRFNWHPGMLLQDTTLQIPFMADLVTMADPTSKFSFLNYLKAQGRIYPFYIRENFLILRNEYNHYCQWAIDQLSNVHFNHQVETTSYDAKEKCYLITSIHTQSGETSTLKAKRLVLGTGTAPYVPSCAKEVLGKQAIHSASYLHHKRNLQTQKSITVVGSGQSAAEVYYDLLQEIDHYNYELNWITRSPRFFPLEYSKLTLEMTSPEYVDYFYGLPAKKRDYLISEQKHLYKGINNELIANIFDLLYTKRLLSDIRVSLRTNSELETINYDEKNGVFGLEVFQHEQEKRYQLTSEGVVFATGYTYHQPAFLEGIRERIAWDEKGRYAVNRNYTIDPQASELFVQNAELHTHGFVTPDLGMACYRNSFIIKEMTGKAHYPIEQRIAFQQFEVQEHEEIPQLTTELTDE